MQRDAGFSVLPRASGRSDCGCHAQSKKQARVSGQCRPCLSARRQEGCIAVLEDLGRRGFNLIRVCPRNATGCRARAVSGFELVVHPEIRWCEESSPGVRNSALHECGLQLCRKLLLQRNRGAGPPAWSVRCVPRPSARIGAPSALRPCAKNSSEAVKKLPWFAPLSAPWSPHPAGPPCRVPVMQAGSQQAWVRRPAGWIEEKPLRPPAEDRPKGAQFEHDWAGSPQKGQRPGLHIQSGSTAFPWQHPFHQRWNAYLAGLGSMGSALVDVETPEE